ncbi:TEL2, telomere maintenance protein 2 [Rhizophlyctis rosea]|uniref:TEL2, telomere maintenance protein 2 n=1 Tax=Rhizophlyctis rosea TaxID=64517 RepID=A0AAD5SCV4_9FUNG|nr:TEL2, telomere maintenance protein 2 [Rhizophlyctis rosea]
MQPSSHAPSRGSHHDPLEAIRNSILVSEDASIVRAALIEPLAFLAGNSFALSQVATQQSLEQALLSSTFFSRVDPTALKTHEPPFTRKRYEQHLEFLVRQCNAHWLVNLTSTERSQLFDPYFIPPTDPPARPGNFATDPHLCLRVLVNAISQKEHSYVLDQVTSLLERLLRMHGVSSFYTAAFSTVNVFKTASTNAAWEDYINIICVIPDKIANVFEKNAAPFFWPIRFFPFVAKSIEEAVYYGAVSDSDTDRLADSLSSLIDKLCRLGHSDSLAEQWFPSLSKLNDQRARSIWQKIIASLPNESLDSLLSAFLKQFGSSESKSAAGIHKLHRQSSIFSTLIGHSNVRKNTQLQYLFRQKFLVDRVFGDEALRVLVCWLSSFEKADELGIPRVLTHLVTVWTDVNFIQHATWEQLQYVTHAILLCLSYSTQEDLKSGGLTSLFISGMGKYLDSTANRVRQLAMVTAECFSKISDGAHVLKFGLLENDEISYLRGLAEPVKDVPEEDVREDIERDGEGEAPTNETKRTIESPSPARGTFVRKDEDSDDEGLEPYDMPDESSTVPESGGKRLKPPRYIRDCMQWLKSEGDPDKLELALKVAATVIRDTSPRELSEISKDLCWSLVNLNNNYSLDDFTPNRMKALIAMGVKMPVEAARHLIDCFYEKNYSIGQRIDVLSCLASSAMELSALQLEEARHQNSLSVPHNIESNSAFRQAPLPLEALTKPTSELTATDIVAERIKAKTRRFSRKSLIPVKKAQANRFAGVAANFLGPLLGGFQNPKYIDLDLGQSDENKVMDGFWLGRSGYNIFQGSTATMLLQKFIKTAGILLHCAAQTPDARRLSRELFDLLWSLRFVPYQTKGMQIQSDLLFGFSCVLTALSPSILVDEFGARDAGSGDVGELYELQRWVGDVLERETDQEVIRMCATVLSIMKEVYEEREGEFLKPFSRISV